MRSARSPSMRTHYRCHRPCGHSPQPRAERRCAGREPPGPKTRRRAGTARAAGTAPERWPEGGDYRESIAAGRRRFDPGGAAGAGGGGGGGRGDWQSDHRCRPAGSSRGYSEPSQSEGARRDAAQQQRPDRRDSADGHRANARPAEKAQKPDSSPDAGNCGKRQPRDLNTTQGSTSRTAESPQTMKYSTRARRKGRESSITNELLLHSIARPSEPPWTMRHPIGRSIKSLLGCRRSPAHAHKPTLGPHHHRSQIVTLANLQRPVAARAPEAAFESVGRCLSQQRTRFVPRQSSEQIGSAAVSAAR